MDVRMLLPAAIIKRQNKNQVVTDTLPFVAISDVRKFAGRLALYHKL